jgi:hypothetical protein
VGWVQLERDKFWWWVVPHCNRSMAAWRSGWVGETRMINPSPHDRGKIDSLRVS